MSPSVLDYYGNATWLAFKKKKRRPTNDLDSPRFSDNCHGETATACCRKAKPNTEHFLSQNQNQKKHVATSSCNWETEQRLKRCRRPKLNPTEISHSLWKWRFYHEIIKARIANSWWARSTTQPVLLVRESPLEQVRKQPVPNEPLSLSSIPAGLQSLLLLDIPQAQTAGTAMEHGQEH